MTDPDEKQLEDLCKAATIIFTMIGEETYFLPQTHDDNPEIGAGEVVLLTITRRHEIEPLLPIGSVSEAVIV